MATTTLSRRGFARLVGAATAVATMPAFPSLLLAKAAGEAKAIRLSANENPYGPSPASIRAVAEAMQNASRYPDDAVDALTGQLAALHRVSQSEVLLGNGSSEILKLAASAWLPKSHRLVMADPAFEALAIYAAAIGAEVVRVPLTAAYAHDLEKMKAATVPGALLYICNPNNPTATITPKAAVRELLGTVPETTMVLVDEAYHHYASGSDYESVIPLVKAHPNLIVARTFSKVYGLAGLRCGYAVAQHPTIAALSAQQSWDSVNAAALAAASAGLRDTDWVATGKRRNAETRSWLYNQLRSKGLSHLPSETNFVMIDLGRDVKPVIASMRARGVEPGRLFPAMPHHLRITIGTPEEMRRFVEVLS
jgi:histidinol-phosphate aminotransferase